MIGNALVAVFCTLVIAAGWFYLARSDMVAKLEPYESPRRNIARRKARRIGAWAMILAAVSGYWLVLELRWRTSPPRVAAAFLLVMFAVVGMIVSVVVDLYLTRRMSRSNRRGPKQ